MFRHSRAMHLYRNGMPLHLVSECLGHGQINTTKEFYANADIEMKRVAINSATSKLNPLLNMLVLSFVFSRVFKAVDNYKINDNYRESLRETNLKNYPENI